MVEPVPDAKPLVRKKDGQLLRRFWMTLRDYSRHTFRHPEHPRRVLGGLQHPYISLNQSSSSTVSSFTSPSSIENVTKRKKPRIINCPLLNPVPVAQMDSDLAEYSTSEIQDKRLWTKRIFHDEFLQSKLMCKEVRAKILSDQKRQYRSSAFDGKMIVVGVVSFFLRSCQVLIVADLWERNPALIYLHSEKELEGQAIYPSLTCMMAA